jgi:plastocyanin
MERMFARMAMLALVAAPLGPRPIAAGVIRGVVHVSSAHASAPTAFQAYPGHANALPDAAMDPRGAPSDAVVYLESLPSGVDDSIQRAPAKPQLAQKGQRFVPRVLPIAAGTTVDFPNMDPIFHNVFSLSPVKRFDLGRYPRGHSKRVTFATPGLVNVFCDIHSSMAAYVLVLPHHAFTQPDSDGDFALPDVPPGRYVVHVWHPDAPATTRSVDVPATGDVSLEVTL